jgi:hypothetical protein
MKWVSRTTIVTLGLVVSGAASASAQVINLSEVGPGGTAVQLNGPQANALAGASLMRADLSGDVDRVDLVVGAPGAGPNGEGQAFVFFMGPTYTTGSLSANASAILTGESAGDQFGAATAAGMVTRAEVSPLPPRDLLVAAPAALGGRGIVYLFPGQFTYGDRRAAAAAPFRIIGAVGDRLGTALVATDLDGDGFRDIVMTAPGTGRIYVVFGGPLSGTRDLMMAAADITITSAAGAVALATADFNVDGVKDLAVGVPSGAGTVFLIKGKSRASFGSTFALTAADAQFTGIDMGDAAGATLQAADVDGDGVTDLVVGAPGGNGPSNSRAAAGEAYVLYGKSAFIASKSLATANVTIYGARAGDRLATALSAGNIRRDKADDMMLLAPGASAAGDIDIVYGAAKAALGATIDLAAGIDRVLRGDPANPPLQSMIPLPVTGKGEDIVAASPGSSPNGMSAAGAVFAVLSPTLQLDPVSTSVTVAQGASATVPLRIRNVGSLTAAWAVRTNTSWFSMSPATGSATVTASGDLTLTVTPGNLPPGNYHGGFTYLSTSRDLVWVDTGSVNLTVTAGSGGTTPQNLFGLPSDPDEGSPNGVNTPVGSNVTVVPIRDFLVRFSNVSQAGRTTVDVQQSSGSPGAGRRATPWIYTVRTTAVFSGPVTVAIAYQGFTTFENDMRILNGSLDVTTSVDTGVHAVYGSVTSLPFTFSGVEDRRRLVTIARKGSGSGSLTMSATGSSCGTNCTGFVTGTTVTFTATPATGSRFTGWSGACNGSAPACTLTMPAERASLSLSWTVKRTRDVTAPAPGAMVSDFDGDVRRDIAVFRPSTGVWHALSTGALGTYTAVTLTGASGDITVPGDYDGDGKTDAALYRPSTGVWSILLSSSGSTSVMTYSLGTSGDIAVPEDYDGDGYTDIAVYRPSTRTWMMLKSSTNYSTVETTTFGLSTDKPVPGDYDGDGKADIAVFRPSTGAWYILQSSVAWVDVFTWGASTDVPVQADYDGDGKTDIGVFRPSTGTWYIVNSSTNKSTFLITSWGLGSDAVVPGDYDGDGKADLAVFRPSTATWYILQSATNQSTYMSSTFGLSSDIPILKRQ